jgi:hypothetical protein
VAGTYSVQSTVYRGVQCTTVRVTKSLSGFKVAICGSGCGWARHISSSAGCMVRHSVGSINERSSPTAEPFDFFVSDLDYRNSVTGVLKLITVFKNCFKNCCGEDRFEF